MIKTLLFKDKLCTVPSINKHEIHQLLQCNLHSC